MEADENVQLEKEPELNGMIPVLVRCDKENPTLRDIYLNKNEFKIGRGRENDEIIYNTMISRSHCVLNTDKDNKWMITNMSSSCTLLNGTALERNKPYTINVGDSIQFSPSPEFRYTIEMRTDDENLDIKRPGLNERIMDNVMQKQNSFAARQELQIKEMEQQIGLKEEEQEKLKSRLEELMKNQEAVQGEFEGKNHEIKALQDQIQAGNNHQSELQVNLTNLVTTLEEERRQFEEKLTKERQTWQQALDMTKQEKETFEKNMAEQMKLWQEQQLANLARERDAMQQKLNQTENALKEQNAVAEQLQTSLQNQQNLLADFATNKNCILVKIDNTPDGQTIELLDTVVADVVDLTNEDEGPSRKKVKTNDQMMNAMDEQFTCSICSELFYKATTVNCSHTFCQYCIFLWRRKSHECPICRTHLISMNRALVLDNFIDEAVSNLTLEERTRRDKMIKERDAIQQPRPHPVVIPRVKRR